MPHRAVVWKIAAPMIGLGVFLLGLGIFAAWNVHEQQQTSSELVAREVRAMVAIEELHVVMRDIRFHINLFLRTNDAHNLDAVSELHPGADKLLARAQELARTDREKELIAVVAAGYQAFFSEFKDLYAQVAVHTVRPPTAQPLAAGCERAAEFTRLSDELLTREVMQPLRECILVNQQVVERTNQASRETAQHLKIGFLLLGLCGGAAGLLMGTAIARTIGRSIVQLNVSVRGAAGWLSDVRGPVTFSHTGDLAAIESGMRQMEYDIAEVVKRLQQRETELLRSEQLARVGQLASGLAHELRNPLMPMKMLVQAALERDDGVGLKGRSLQVMNEEIARLEESIQTFLDFARPPVPEKFPADLSEIVWSTRELILPRARRQQVEVQLRLPESPVVAKVDRGQIRQLVLNLLLNALDEMPEGGRIEVGIERNVPAPPPQVDPEAKRRGANSGPADPHVLDENEPAKRSPAPVVANREITEHDAMRMVSHPSAELPQPATQRWLAIRVADNGPGIPPALLQTIFEPFVTTKETGTGLGLSICQRIALDHQGALQVRNRPAGGVEFTLSLPYET